VAQRAQAVDAPQLRGLGDIEGEKDDPGHANLSCNGPHRDQMSPRRAIRCKRYRRSGGNRWLPAESGRPRAAAK
jgi:hypothetical protein